MATDLVCGMTVTEETNFRYDYQGNTYLFCSDYCEQQFRADPSRYLQQAPASTVSGASRYRCPMHPEVTQEHPGKCPKCGMALEKQ